MLVAFKAHAIDFLKEHNMSDIQCPSFGVTRYYVRQKQPRRDLQVTSQIKDFEVRGHEFLFAAFKHVGVKGEILKRTKLPLKLKLQIAFFLFTS